MIKIDDGDTREQTQRAKADAGKLRPSLVPVQIIRDIAEVREYGNRKYESPDSWREISIQRYIDALYRHWLLYVDDPNGVDDESGIKHYKHVACNMAFICEMMKERTEYVAPPVDWSKVEVDTPILVSMDGDEWEMRHFATYVNGVVKAWDDGGTSYTEKEVCPWPYAKLAEENK